MFIKLSFILFVIFFSNVLWASWGNNSLLTNVQELLVLCTCILLFVIGILRAETIHKTTKGR